MTSPQNATAQLPSAGAPSDEEFDRLAEMREGLRAYLAWAEAEARRHQTTPMQFQLALAIRSSREPDGPTVSQLAETLQVKHHSVVGLIDRAESAGLVHRERDDDNASRVRVSLTPQGTELVGALALRHQEHVRAIAPRMAALWDSFSPSGGDAA